MYKLLLIVLSITFLTGCSKQSEKRSLVSNIDKNSLSFFNDFENNSSANVWFLNKNQIKGSNNKFLHFNKEDLYGGTFKMQLPDSFNVSSAVVKVSFKYRSFGNKTCKYVFTVKDTMEQLLWHASDFNNLTNDWAFFSDSVLIPAAKHGDTELTLYGFNPNQMEFDIDSLTVTIENKIFPSYLKDVKNNFHLFPSVKLENPIFESVSLVSFVKGIPEPAKFELNGDSSARGGNKYFDIEVKQLNQ